MTASANVNELAEVWPAPASGALDRALASTLEALSTQGPRPVQKRLRTFYNVASDYAGATFAELAPESPNEITAADLHATSLLSVELKPGATRRLLQPGTTRDAVVEVLSRIGVDARLETVDKHTADAMKSLYFTIKASLSGDHVNNPNPWVTASKLCARKRPGLFPVRDNDVCGLLGIGKRWDADLAMFQALMRRREVRSALDQLPEMVRQAADGRTLVLDREPLRLLDAALWTWQQSDMGRD
jgi:hypothetical protein